MVPTFGRGGACALALAVLLTVATPGPAAPATRKHRVRIAVSFIASEQNRDGSVPGFSPLGSTADAVVSMVAARRGPRQIRRAIDYLEDQVADADSIGLKAKIVMAAVAAGENPRAFGGVDLVQDIESSEQPDGRFGADTAVLHHALALLALVAADVEPSSAAADWLVAAQCDDGGWQFDEPVQEGEDEHCSSGATDFFQSESDTTAAAVMSLSRFERWEPGDDNDPFAFFESRRDPRKRGWGYDRSFPITNANSTALVIEAYRAHPYRDLPAGARRALIRLQHRLCGKNAGAFAFTYEERDDGTLKKGPPDVAATIGAILGLVRRPLDAVGVTKRPPRRTRC